MHKAEVRTEPEDVKKQWVLEKVYDAVGHELCPDIQKQEDWEMRFEVCGVIAIMKMASGSGEMWQAARFMTDGSARCGSGEVCGVCGGQGWQGWHGGQGWQVLTSAPIGTPM